MKLVVSGFLSTFLYRSRAVSVGPTRVSVAWGDLQDRSAPYHPLRLRVQSQCLTTHEPSSYS